MAKGLGRAVRCDGCDVTLRDYHGDPNSPYQVVRSSKAMFCLSEKNA